MRIHHIALICSDYAVSKRFYTETLGLTVLAEHYRAERDSWKLDLGIGSHYALELFSFPNPPPRPGRPISAEACGLRHLAFAVADVAAKRAQLQGLGVDCEAMRAPMNTPAKISFLFKIPISCRLSFIRNKAV